MKVLKFILVYMILIIFIILIAVIFRPNAFIMFTIGFIGGMVAMTICLKINEDY